MEKKAAGRVITDTSTSCSRAQIIGSAQSVASNGRLLMRFSTASPFAWPLIEGQSANLVPPADGTMDFFYLFDLREGRIAWQRPRAGIEFAYQLDPRVFPCAWMFASYGGFLGHYTVVLEPCTTMPISVNEATAKQQCSVLQSGETLATRVSIRAGRRPE